MIRFPPQQVAWLVGSALLADWWVNAHAYKNGQTFWMRALAILHRGALGRAVSFRSLSFAGGGSWDPSRAFSASHHALQLPFSSFRLTDRCSPGFLSAIEAVLVPRLPEASPYP